MSGILRDEDWDLLLRRLSNENCTPFLGAGACYGVLPLGADLAKQWATKYDYPMEDPSNLISVAQFLALKYSDSIFPKDLIVEMFKGFGAPDFTDALEPHRVLASLPLPVYVTTNYDDFMVRALTRHHREPKRVLCQWNKAVKDYIKDNPTIFETGAWLQTHRSQSGCLSSARTDSSGRVAGPDRGRLHGFSRQRLYRS